MKNKILLFLGMSLFSTYTFAQCPDPLNRIDVQLLMNPLQYKYDYTSREMQGFDGQRNPNLLGLYSGQKSVVSKPVVLMYGLHGRELCAAVTSINVQVLIKPVIYISKEAQQFTCTRKRIEEHELQHHQFEINVAAKSRPIIEQLSRKYFGQAFRVYSPEQSKKIVEERNAAFIEEVLQYMRNQTEPLHARIDTIQNYKYESSFCSNTENIAVWKLLKR